MSDRARRPFPDPGVSHLEAAHRPDGQAAQTVLDMALGDRAAEPRRQAVEVPERRPYPIRGVLKDRAVVGGRHRGALKVMALNSSVWARMPTSVGKRSMELAP